MNIHHETIQALPLRARGRWLSAVRSLSDGAPAQGRPAPGGVGPVLLRGMPG